MAVRPGAARIDDALDRVAALMSERMAQAEESGRPHLIAQAIDIAALWHLIAGYALEHNDPKLAALAASEHHYFIELAVDLSPP